MLSDYAYSVLLLVVFIVSFSFFCLFAVIGLIAEIKKLCRKEVNLYAKKNVAKADNQEDESGKYF